MNNIPRITPEHVQAQVVSASYHRFPGTTVTVCCLVLRNGFNSIGHSACVSPELFDADIGKDIAYKDALGKVWQLEGYLLAEFLHHAKTLPVPEGGMVQAVPAGHVVGDINAAEAASYRSSQPEPASWGSLGEPVTDLGQNDERIQSGTGGDYAGAGASGSWEAPSSSPEAASPASDPAGTSYTDAGSGI